MRRIHPITVWLFGAATFCAVFVLVPLTWMLLDTVWDGSHINLSAWRLLLRDPIDRQMLLVSIELGLAASSVAVVLGLGHAWLTFRTDLPFARVLGPLGILPLVVPPILVAMGFSDLADTRGFTACALLLGVAYAPFVAVLGARGLQSISGDAYDAARIARGRLGAERWLLRAILPEVAAGALLAFIFVLSEHGVPEFLTVKGKTWHTYAEGIFSKWTRRATGVDHTALASPIVAALPLVLILVIALLLALRLRGRGVMTGQARSLPIRRLGWLRFPALIFPAVYLGAGVGVPVFVMAAWSAGSTSANVAPSAGRAIASAREAMTEVGGDLSYTIAVAICATLLLLVVAIPIAWFAARKNGILDHLSILPVAVPATLLAIGMVRVFNRDLFFTFYDNAGLLVAAYAARFLPFGVLTLSAAVRRVPEQLEQAALFSQRGALSRGLIVHLPLLFPAIWSAACLVLILGLRELDVAVMLPAGNGTVVRRLSNIVHFGGEEVGGALALLLLLVALIVPGFTVLLTGRKLRSLS